MFSAINLGLLVLVALTLTPESALGREQWLERNGRAVILYPRRFGQEQPVVLQKIRDACPGAVCGTLAGQAVTPLLATQPECTQQDMADAIIDASKQFDAATAAKMVAAAIEYRQVEKNTPPDFTTNPPTLRNSVFCQKTPKNAQLNGLIQAQDPDNDPNIFFDPALQASVTKGSQANTTPFGGVAAKPPAASTPSETPILTRDPTATVTDCPTATTVTVTSTTTTFLTSSTPPANTPSATPAGADFGSCTVPEIEFGVGFDNRKETSFQPTDKQSFSHGSAQNIAIITQFICDTLTNSCKANQAAKDVCATARQAAAAATAGTGAQADAFNGVFGITTKFATVAVVDNQGNTVSPGSTSVSPATATPAPTADGFGIGNFGKCSIPQIEFGAGFDGRRETSFQPVDKASFNHGSAQNIDIITRSVCDTLTNSCGADQTAKDTCARGLAEASAAPKGTGAQADAFNAVFGINTQFSSVSQIDNQGRVVSGQSMSNDGRAKSTTLSAMPTHVATSAARTPCTTTGNLQGFSGTLGRVMAHVVRALAAANSKSRATPLSTTKTTPSPL